MTNSVMHNIITCAEDGGSGGTGGGDDDDDETGITMLNWDHLSG